jgi:hypothetical protein
MIFAPRLLPMLLVIPLNAASQLAFQPFQVFPKP